MENMLIQRIKDNNDPVDIDTVIRYITQQPPYTYMWYQNNTLRVDGTLTKDELEAIVMVINEENSV